MKLIWLLSLVSMAAFADGLTFQNLVHTNQEWAFLGRFCFLSLRGHFIYNISFPKDYGPVELLLYYDAPGLWEAVYRSNKTCVERIKPLDQRRNQVILLEVNERGCVSSTDPLPRVQCSGIIGFQTARPRWWYIATANCRKRANKKANYTGLYLRYRLDALNDADRWWFMHFSADQFYILQFDIAFLVIYVILCGLASYTAYKLSSRNLLHKTYKLYLISLGFQLAHLIMIIGYYYIIADSGVDYSGIKLIANIFTTVSTLSLQLMLLLIGKGYTVTRARLKARTTIKIHGLMASYAVLYVSLLMYEQCVFDPGYVLYLYESPAGYAIVVLRLLSWGWFVYAVVFTLYRYPEKLSFYTQLVVIYTTWFVSMPALVLIATFAIPNWIREKSVSFVEELIMAFAHIAFLHMVWPSRTNDHFPFHVRANKVVPRGENPSYPHHAYAPSNENNNLTGVNTIEALKEAYREMTAVSS
ncbi:transmembrane protein 145-like [Varroa jacobsoni]|uniref:Intimal thickness related receptor IRP domain-containing protein n=1 Tax=Varroa destructor TaxID=109461 RepID=A0A7M7MIB5_VARDE|nr:transmembrane protein 145-like [Varroa destructor]XP_022702805.1 transmembrane protein 145-like [Varroa jacobsoni]